MKKILAVALFTALPLLTLNVDGAQGDEDFYDEDPTAETTAVTDEAVAPTEAFAVMGEDGIQRVVVTAPSGFTFTPKRVIVKVGVPVELTMRKKSFMVPHKIVAEDEEAGVAFTVKLKRKDRVVEFTPTRTGEYVFYCSTTVPFLKSHRERGMEGVIVVVD